jgi:hypothetical protein
MNDNNLKNDIDSLDNRFSINMFLTDLPRVLNNTFSVLKKALNKFYDPTQNKLTSDIGKFTRVESNSIITRNLSLLNENGTDTISYDTIAELLKRVEELENKLK